MQLGPIGEADGSEWDVDFDGVDWEIDGVEMRPCVEDEVVWWSECVWANGTELSTFIEVVWLNT